MRTKTNLQGNDTIDSAWHNIGGNNGLVSSLLDASENPVANKYICVFCLGLAIRIRIRDPPNF